ncbi:hypothetical protein DSECCO2_311320 [anaerobic digester metagenome]
MHPQLEREVFGRRQGQSRGDDPLHRRVVGEVQEDDGALESTRALEVLHERVRLLLRDAHPREDHGKLLDRARNLGLAGDLERDVVVRKARSGEDRQLLTTHERVRTVDRRDTGLDKLRRHAPGVRIDRSARDVDSLLGHDLGPTVDRFAAAREDPAEHLVPHRHLDRLAREPDPRITAESGRRLEHLHDHELVRGIEDLSALGRAVCERDVDELAVPDRLRLLDEEQGAGDLTDGPIFLHALDLSVVNSDSIALRMPSSMGS